MNKERLSQNIENTIYNKFRFACKSDEEFNMFMNGIKRYLKIYEDEIEEFKLKLQGKEEENETLKLQYKKELESGLLIVRIQDLIDIHEKYKKQIDEKTREAQGFIELFDKKQHENYAQFCEIQQLKKQIADWKERYACYKNKSSEDSEFKPVFKCNLRLVREDESLIEIVPSNSYTVEGDEIEFTCVIPNRCSAVHAKQITDLKAALAEKEKENTALAHIIAGWNENNQDKISFAVEKLEKVKTRIQEDFDYDDLMYWLNNQIKELKEGK